MRLVPSGQDVVQVLGSDNFKSERDLKTGGKHGDGQQEQCQFSQLNQSSPFQHPAPTLYHASTKGALCTQLLRYQHGVVPQAVWSLQPMVPLLFCNTELWVLLQTSRAGLSVADTGITAVSREWKQELPTLLQFMVIRWGQHMSHIYWSWGSSGDPAACNDQKVGATSSCHHISLFGRVQVYLWQVALAISGYSCLWKEQRSGKGLWEADFMRWEVGENLSSTTSNLRLHTTTMLCARGESHLLLSNNSTVGYFAVVKILPLQTFLTSNRLCLCKGKASEVMQPGGLQ